MMKKLPSCALAGILLALSAAPAAAGPSDYSKALTAKSLKEGFGSSSLAVLEREQGPGREIVAKNLFALLNGRLGRRLTAGDLESKGQSHKRLVSYVGENSYLEVYADGTKFRFRASMEDDNLPKAPPSGGFLRRLVARTPQVDEKLSDAELERLGRSFIGSLGDLARITKEDTVTFLGSRYLRNGDLDPDGRVSEEVAASIGIFGREIRGIPVIGKGSKIAVWFDRNRDVVAFDVDWPAYKTTETIQEALPKEELDKRIEAAAASFPESAGNGPSRFECGYVDPGATVNGGPIQAGCSVSYEGRTGGSRSPEISYKWARIDFVPAGVKVLEDTNWALADFLAKGGSLEKGAAVTSMDGKGDPGPPPLDQ